MSVQGILELTPRGAGWNLRLHYLRDERVSRLFEGFLWAKIEHTNQGRLIQREIHPRVQRINVCDHLLSGVNLVGTGDKCPPIERDSPILRVILRI